jgi:hypothetical protein
MTIQFNYTDTAIDTNKVGTQVTAVADGNIDTCGARAVTDRHDIRSDRGRKAVRREGKGKASTSHRVITSTTHKPPPSFSHTC